LAGRHDYRWSCPGAMRPTGRAAGQRSSWQRKSAAPSGWTARNRRTRTRMYGGVGARRGNPPGDPIGRCDCLNAHGNLPLRPLCGGKCHPPVCRQSTGYTRDTASQANATTGIASDSSSGLWYS
jgi:hypothetical protein